MSNFAVCRIAKMKTRASIGGMGGHVSRDRDTPNADPSVKNFVLTGSGRMLDDYDKRMAELSIPKIRKNAVLAIDFMLTASPNHFLLDGKRDNQKIADFTKTTKNWLKEKWGDNFISATLHLDEKTPHIHAVIIPEIEGKLRANHWFDGREKMSKLQDEFSAATTDLGLERGIKGSKAKHTSIQKYYSQVNKVEALANKVKTQTGLIHDLEARLEPFVADKMVRLAKSIDIGESLLDRPSERSREPKIR